MTSDSTPLPISSNTAAPLTAVTATRAQFRARHSRAQGSAVLTNRRPSLMVRRLQPHRSHTPGKRALKHGKAGKGWREPGKRKEWGKMRERAGEKAGEGREKAGESRGKGEREQGKGGREQGKGGREQGEMAGESRGKWREPRDGRKTKRDCCARRSEAVPGLQPGRDSQPVC